MACFTLRPILALAPYLERYFVADMHIHVDGLYTEALRLFRMSVVAYHQG